MRLILASTLLIGVSACSVGQESPSVEPTPTSKPTAPDSGVPAQPDASDTMACAEVRAGIDAFNAGDFAGTVDRFRRALPLARADARTDPSEAADDLVEAVTFYAELAPKDYPESARSSSEFAKYKAITLGQCKPVGEPSQEGSSEPPEVTA